LERRLVLFLSHLYFARRWSSAPGGAPLLHAILSTTQASSHDGQDLYLMESLLKRKAVPGLQISLQFQSTFLFVVVLQLRRGDAYTQLVFSKLKQQLQPQF
jgi:hypothetical protein